MPATHDPSMQAPWVLQFGPLPEVMESGLRSTFQTTVHHELTCPAEWLQEHGELFEALATSVPYGASRELLKALPNLKVISNVGVGTDSLDLQTARARGIRVSNTPDLLDDCVADLAMGMLIDLARGISMADRYVRQGTWITQGAFQLMRRVTGKRLGILGLGRIGRAIAQRASGFRMDIRYTNRQPVPGVDWPHEPVLLELAAWADFLVVCCPGGSATRHLVSEPVIQALGPTGHLINVSRGSVVDELALVHALVAGALGGAALDVYANEPNVPSELMTLENVLLLPHMASATEDARRDMGLLALRNLQQFFADGTLLTPVI